MAERCSAHIRSTSGSWALRKRGALQYVDRHHHVTATTQVDQRQREFVSSSVENPTTIAPSELPPGEPMFLCALEFIASVEDGVEHTVELGAARCRHPASGVFAAECDDAGRFTVAQRGLHNLGGAADNPLGADRRGPAGCG